MKTKQSQLPAVVDNDFISVLWRRLACDFRIHAGWKYEDMESSFRKTVKQTLEEFPPENIVSLKKI